MEFDDLKYSFWVGVVKEEIASPRYQISLPGLMI